MLPIIYAADKIHPYEVRLKIDLLEEPHKNSSYISYLNVQSVIHDRVYVHLHKVDLTQLLYRLTQL